MAGKELNFKIVMEADTKNYVSNIKESESVTKAIYAAIKQEAERLKAASVEAAQEVGKIVPDDLQKKADQAKGKLSEVSQAAGELEGQAIQAASKIDGLGNELQDTAAKANKAGFEIGEAIPGDTIQLAEILGTKFFTAAKEIEALGDKSVISAGELRSMSSIGEQGINELNSALKAAQAELVRLQSTDGTLKDIGIAKQRVLSIEDAIKETSSAFNYYQDVAINAMRGVDNATQSSINQLQRFSSVDLGQVVGEAQTATRAIQSMGEGANLSTKEIERIGTIGTSSINTLESELLAAKNAFSALEQSSEAVTLEEIKAAGEKVKGLEQAVDLTKAAFADFDTQASSAMRSVSTSADKATTSAKQTGHEIYEALGIKPPTVINDAITALERKLEDFKANSKLPAEEVERVTRITEQQIEKLKSELHSVEPAAEKANSGVSNLSKGMGVAKFAATALAGAMAAVGIGIGVREIAQAADSYTTISARINIATSEGGNFQQAMAGVHQVALATNSSLEATASLFTKVNDVGKQMGMTQQQSLDLVKTINMAIQTGGGSAQASEDAIVQFTQALQSGVLRGDEFNSIMEQAPGISKALAQSLGVTTGELRTMAENGELSAERVIKALQKQSAAIEADYNKFPTTISNALQKIATQWQILIGEMDQANGASAAVANALSIIADNLGILKLFFDDVAEGVGYFASKFSDIDPSILNALRDTLTQVYENIKQNIKYVIEFSETVWSAFTSALDAVSPLFNALLDGGEDVSGLTTLLNVLRMAIAGISDAGLGLNVGLKILLSSIQFLAGGVYSLAAATLEYIPFMGDLAEEAEKTSDRMFAQAEKNMRGAIKLSTEHKWAVVETYEDIQKTQKQKNEEAIADNARTFAELTKQNIDLVQKSKELATERAALDTQLNQARKDGNQSTIDAIIQKSGELENREKEHATSKAKLDKDMLVSAQAYAEAAIKANGGVMDGTMQADLMTKGYIVTMDKAGKVSVAAWEGAAQAADNAAKKEEAVKLAKENLQRADEAYLAFQKQSAVERAVLEQQIAEAKRTGDLSALKSAQDSLRGIDQKETELANNRNVRAAELDAANSGSGQVAENAYSRASLAAKQLGVDIDVALNRVSKSFTEQGNNVTDLKGKLASAGITGKAAGDIIYQSWSNWLQTAKSQAEIDYARSKLKEFGDQGKVSTGQVEQGLIAIKMQALELPDDIDPVTEAFKRLGIETKENLKLAAQQALMDYITVRDSGKATAEGIQKAYEKAAQSAAASGDAGVIAATNAANAGRNLEIQIDDSGQAVVKTMDDWVKANNRVESSASAIGDGYREAGRVAREEAKSSTEAWSEALTAMQGKLKASKTGVMAKNGYSVDEIEQQLTEMGYSGNARQKAKELFETAQQGPGGYYRSASHEYAARYGVSAYDNQKQTGNYMFIAEQLEKLEEYAGKSGSVGAGSKAKTVVPEVNINSLAPDVSYPKTSLPVSDPARIVRYEFDLGNGKTATMYGSPNDGDELESMLRKLEMIKKSS